MTRARINTPLRQALIEQGRRQSWLADRLSVDPRQVWGWVHGLHVPSDGTRTAIAQALDVPEHELWPGHESEAA